MSGNANLTCCARCAAPLARIDGGDRKTASPPADTAPPGPRPGWTPDWSFDEDLREAQRLVRRVQFQCAGGAASHDGVPCGVDSAAPAEDAVCPRTSHPHRGIAAMFAWGILGLGLSGLMCGTALLIWSHVAHRPELWTAGLPIAMVSQAVLICGVLLSNDVRRPARRRVRPSAERAAQTHVHLHAGNPGTAGLSLHINAAAPRGSGGDTAPLEREIAAAIRRRAA